MKKKVLVFSVAMLLAFGFSSCSSDTEYEEIPSALEAQVSMNKYDSLVIEQRELITDFCIESLESNKTRVSSSSSYLTLKDELLPSAVEFTRELGMTDKDMEDILGVKIVTQEDRDDAMIGILMFSTVADYSNSNTALTRGGSFGDCFSQATGIAAGVALVGGLAKGTMTKAMIKSVVKLAARVGGRAISGVGLALIAAEIAWCMW